ncbi:MAG TPA: hypothetical protein VMD77_02085 [Candidatus Baltobacteraceae bacterium]|nr:hypothetical protein [Verrucomicrobiae bacterium]HTX14055.1 hypothetical protein [Candidatus Baltobacteraceae bacterium]
MKRPKKKASFSDEAVKAKTGKAWREWFAILDKAGAKKWKHSEIARHLHEKRGLPGWWCQMVAVEYERARGLRVKFQGSSGSFAANVGRTLPVAAAKVYKVWVNEKQRRKWLGAAKMEITTQRKNKVIRAAWNGNESRINVAFYPKGPKKVQIAMDHMKLKSAKEVAKMKTFWFAALNRLEKAF